MEFSERELELIAKAKKKAADVKVKRIVIIIAMILGVVLMVTGTISADKTAYLLVAAVFSRCACHNLATVRNTKIWCRCLIKKPARGIDSCHLGNFASGQKSARCGRSRLAHLARINIDERF